MYLAKFFLLKELIIKPLYQEVFFLLIVTSILFTIGYFTYGKIIEAFPNINESKIKRDFLRRGYIQGRECSFYLNTIESAKSIRIIKSEKLQDLLNITVQAELSNMNIYPTKIYKGEFIFKYEFHEIDWDFQDIVVNSCSEQN